MGGRQGPDPPDHQSIGSLRRREAKLRRMLPESWCPGGGTTQMRHAVRWHFAVSQGGTEAEPGPAAGSYLTSRDPRPPNAPLTGAKRGEISGSRSAPRRVGLRGGNRWEGRAGPPQPPLAFFPPPHPHSSQLFSSCQRLPPYKWPSSGRDQNGLGEGVGMV